MPHIFIEKSYKFRAKKTRMFKRIAVHVKPKRKWLTDEQKEWCQEHLSAIPRFVSQYNEETPTIFGANVYFKNDEDCLVFALKWL